MTRLDLLVSEAFQDFLKQHPHTDTSKLLLSGKLPADQLREAADQLISRHKAKDKLPTWHQTPGIVFPPPLSLEQASSESTALFKNQLFAGQHLVDLTGGMGVDVWAFAKNFPETTYVEQSEWLCQVFAHNAQLLGLSTHVANTSAENFLSHFTGQAHFYIDPARRDAQQRKVFRFSDCTPNVVALLPHFREKAKGVMIKASPIMDISLAIQELQHVHRVCVVAVKNEVKEVLFLLDFASKQEPTIESVNLESDQPPFQFTQSVEAAAISTFSRPQRYLYDPNAAILKAGAFKHIARHFALQKLAINTHLYTSEALVSGFPGRVFEVIQFPLKKSDIPSLLPQKQSNIISKNHPLKPEEIKKQLGLRDGGEFFVFAFRQNDGKPYYLLARMLRPGDPTFL